MKKKILDTYSLEETRSINECIMYLHVIVISDLFTISGTHMKESIMRRIPIQSQYTWPNTQKPSAKHWRIWDAYINQVVCVRNAQLSTPIGKWYFGKYNPFEHYYHHPSNSIFQLK